jgi:hypothetical protein
MNRIRERIPVKTRVDINRGALTDMLKLVLAYTVVIICALAQGFAQPNTGFLLVGSAFSFLACGLHAYNIMLLRERTGPQMIKMSLVGFLVAGAFLFNLYVTFYCGAWALISLFRAFSFPRLVAGAVLALAGASAITAGSDLMQIERFAAHQVDAAAVQHENETTSSNPESERP